MKNATIKDIAKALGISSATVSRVLNNSGYASEDVKERVFACAQAMNYTPNIAAKSLKINKTNMIGVVVPDISNPYFMSAAKGIEDALDSKELTLLIASTNENETKEERILKTLMQHRIDCLVLATAGLNKERLDRVLNKNVPTVLFDRIIEDDDTYNYVVEDNYRGAYELVERVLLENHQEIGFVVGSMRTSTGKERLRGAQDCMIAYGLDVPEFNYYYGNFTMEDGRRAADYFMHLDTIPTAIVSFNNTMTQGMVNRFIELDILNRNTITIASYGGLDFESLLDSQYFFSRKQHPYNMGKEVGKIINEMIIDKSFKKQKVYVYGNEEEDE